MQLQCTHQFLICLIKPYMRNTYDTLLSMPHWKRKRAQILKRDQNKCCNCGSITRLQVHHRQYHKNKRTGIHIAPWQYANHLLITLCNTCHTSGHQLYKVPTHHI